MVDEKGKSTIDRKERVLQLGTSSRAESGRIVSPSHPTIERCRCKYRGFWHVLRFLTIDPVVARPALGGTHPVQLTLKRNKSRCHGAFNGSKESLSGRIDAKAKSLVVVDSS
jgi:hypothetical protein